MSDQRITWLREQVTARMRTARAAAKAKPDGEEWRADPDPEVWGPGAGTGVLRGDGNGVAMAIGSYVADHIATNDPRQVIADCEADLAILDEHQPIGGDENECARCVTWDEDEEGDLCASPHPWPCRTVRLLASAYRHQPWYAEHWGWGDSDH